MHFWVGPPGYHPRIIAKLGQKDDRRQFVTKFKAKREIRANELSQAFQSESMVYLKERLTPFNHTFSGLQATIISMPGSRMELEFI